MWIQSLEGIGLTILGILAGVAILILGIYLWCLPFVGMIVLVVAVINPSFLPGTQGNLAKRGLYKFGVLLIATLLWPLFVGRTTSRLRS